MLTPSKIKNHHFEASGKNAYRAQSVDDFFDIVADSYEQMFKENGELVKNPLYNGVADGETLAGYYEIERIQPYDMFPQTKHVETLVCLTRRS